MSTAQDAERLPPAPFFMSYMTIADGRNREFGFLGGYRTNHLQPRQDFHRHLHYEIVYVLDGEFVQHMENGVFRYRAGDACFLNPNVKHKEGFESGCTLVFLNLGQEFFESLYARQFILWGKSQYRVGEIKRFVQENRVTDAGLKREYLDFAGTSGLRQSGHEPEASRLMDQIAQEMALAETGYAFRVQALLLRFFEELEDPRHYHLSRIRIDSNSEDFIYARLIRYLEERNGRMTRSELGEILHYNGDYLNRIVKRQTGLTIAQLGQKICLQKAKRLFAETGLSISAIIRELGFTNRTYFYRMFSQAEGMSPQQFRQEFGKKE